MSSRYTPNRFHPRTGFVPFVPIYLHSTIRAKRKGEQNYFQIFPESMEQPPAGRIPFLPPMNQGASWYDFGENDLLLEGEDVPAPKR